MQLIIMSAVVPSKFIVFFILFFLLLLSPSELNSSTRLILFQSFTVYLNPLDIPHIAELINTHPVSPMSVSLDFKIVLSECIEPCHQVLLRRILLLVLSYELYKGLFYFLRVLGVLEK